FNPSLWKVQALWAGIRSILRADLNRTREENLWRTTVCCANTKFNDLAAPPDGRFSAVFVQDTQSAADVFPRSSCAHRKEIVAGHRNFPVLRQLSTRPCA